MGKVLAEAGSRGEGIVVSEIDLALSDRKERISEASVDEINLFSDRRLELYGRVTNRPV
jgi:predicted amidohydrolase